MKCKAVRLICGLVVTLSVAMSGCECECDPEPTKDAGPKTGRLKITNPANGANLTYADDEDAVAPGINYTVEVTGENVKAGTLISLSNSAGGTIDPVTISNGRALFTGVTFVEGAPPDGLVNELTASGGSYESDTIAVTVIGQAVSECHFVSPEDGDTLTVDSNPGLEYFQTDAVVACSGSAIPADAEVRLIINGDNDNPRTTTLSSGQATFTGVTLPEGANTLLAHSFNIGGTRIGDSTVNVTVDSGRCDAVISAPATDTVFTAATTDLDPATADVLDTNLTVDSTRCPSGTVSISVNGIPSGSGTLSSGTGQIQTGLAQGNDTVIATVTDGSGTRTPGDSMPVHYQVDSLAPEISVGRPVEAAVLGVADDESEQLGLQYTTTGTLAHWEGATLTVDVTCDGTALTGSPFEITDINGTTGNFSFQLPGLPSGACTLEYYAIDGVDNSDIATVNVTVVDLELPILSAAVDSDADSNDVLTLAEDGSSTTAGYQLNLSVTIADVTDATTYAAICYAQPVDDQGAAVGNPIELDPPVQFAANGEASCTLTLADGGRYNVYAVARKDTIDSEPTAEHIVVVDFLPPDLVITAPANNTIQSATTVTIVAQTTATDYAPTQTALFINGNQVTAVPVVSDGRITYNNVALSGSPNGEYVISVVIFDIHGNENSATARVLVDGDAPMLVIGGWSSPSATARHLDLSDQEASPTSLHTQQDPDLDYHAATAGLQFGFRVVVTGETAETLGDTPRVRLAVEGFNQPFFADLVDNAGTLEAIFDQAGAGITLDDGPFSVSASVTDAAGNEGTDERFSFVRTSTYYMRIDSPSEGMYLGTLTVDVVASGEVYPNAPCDMLVDGGTVATATIDSNYEITFEDVNLVAAGPHTLQVICGTGSEQGVSLVRNVTVDLDGPTGITFLTAATDTAGAVPESGYYGLTWASTSGVDYQRAIEVHVDAEAGACPFQDATLVVTPTAPSNSASHYNADGLAGARWTYSGTDCVTTFSDVVLGGANEPGQTSTLHVDMMDLAGNPANGETSVSVDQVAPTLVQQHPAAGVTQLGRAYDDSPVEGLQMVSTNRWRFAVSDENLTGDVVLSYSGQATGTATAVAVDGTVLVSTDWPEDGDYTVGVTVSDAAGNSASIADVVYVVDTDAPSLVMRDKDQIELSRENSSKSEADGAPVIMGVNYDVDSVSPGAQLDFDVIANGVRTGFWVRLCSDNYPVSATEDCEASNSAGGTAAVTGRVIDEYWTLASGGDQGFAVFSAVNLEQGTHHLYVETDDEANNHSTTVPVEINIDTYAPTVATLDVLANTNTANDAACTGECINALEMPAGTTDIEVTVSTFGDSEDLTGVAVSLASNNGAQGAIPDATLSGSGSTYTATFSAVSLVEGSHRFSASLSDGVGNASIPPTAANNPQIFVDTVAPVVESHTRIAQEQFADATFDITVTASDGANAVEGYPVTLSKTTAPTWQDTVAIGAGLDSALFGAVSLTDNAVNDLTATIVDMVGNPSAAYDFAYDVDTSAPAMVLLAPTTEQTLSGTGTCLESDIFHVSITGYNRSGTTIVELQSRSWGTTGDFGTIANSSRSVTGDSADLQFTAPNPCFAPGSREVRARIYETDTGHEEVTSTVRVNIDLGVPVVTIKRLLGVSELVTGYSFLEPEDTNATVGVYETSLHVESDAPENSTVKLLINGTQFGGDQTLPASQTVTFTNVPLQEYSALPAGNVIRAEVTHVTSMETGVNEATDCKADGDLPTIEFDSTVAKTYLAVDDTEPGVAGLNAADGNGISFTTTGVEEAVTIATLTCTGMSPDATVDPVSNAGEFTDMTGLVTSTTDYVCSLSVSDFSGNQATSTSTKTLTVDIDRPATPEVVSCIGVDTGAENYEIDDNSGTAKCYVSSDHSGACGNGVDGIDVDKCSRRASNVTLTWVAPGEDGTGGGKVSSYTIRYATKDLTNTPSCASGDMSSATTADTSSLTGDAIVVAGGVQDFTISDLGVHKDYCFEVTAMDQSGNSATSSLLLRRVPLIATAAKTGTHSSFGNSSGFTSMSLSGDIDGDGRADLVVGESGFTRGSDPANGGRFIVYYSSGASDTVVEYPEADGHHGGMFGHQVGVGDFNGDGYFDVVVSEPFFDTYAGRLYVYFGADGGISASANPNSTPAEEDLPSLIADVVISGNAFSSVGWSLAPRPINFNGDNNVSNPMHDIVAFAHAGTSSTMVVIFGQTSWTTPLALNAATDATYSFPFIFGNHRRYLPANLQGDSDAYDDIVISASYLDEDHGTIVGILGQQTPPATLTDYFAVTGGVQFGHTATTLDGDGDSKTDIAVFDFDDTVKRTYFYRSNTNPPTESGYISAGGGGRALETMGDLNGDGIEDFCIGNNNVENPAGIGHVKCYRVSSGQVDDTELFTFEYPDYASSGSHLAGGGDYDGDGYLDLAVLDASGTGAIYIVK